MEELYNQLYKDGKYTKTFEDFQNQFGTPEKSEKLYIALNEAGDYTKSFDDFKAQFVLAGKTNDSVIADPNAESEKNDMGSNSEKPLSAWQSIKNTFLKAGERLGDIGEFWGTDEGMNSALDIATNSTYSLLVGQKNIDDFVEKYGEDSWVTEGLGTQDTLEAIEKYKKEQEESAFDTKQITQSIKEGDIAGVGAGIVEGFINGLSSVAYFLGTAGAGIYAENVAENYITYNEQKAKNLGMSLPDLIKSGEADNLAPVGLGATSVALERFSLGRIGKAAAGKDIIKNISGKLIYNKSARNVANILAAGSTEFVTEILQHATDKVNEEFGRTAGTEDPAKVLSTTVNAIFSQEGLEAGLQGFFGGGGMAMTGRKLKTLSNIRTTVDGDVVDKAIEDLAANRVKLNVETDPTAKEGIQLQIDKLEQLIADSVIKGNQIYDSLTEEQLSEVENLSDLADTAAFKITELNKKLRFGEIDKAGYDAAVQGFTNQYKQARQGLIDLNLEKNLEFAKQEAESRGLKFKIYETTKALQQAMNRFKTSKENKQLFKDNKNNIHGFAIGDQIFINKEVASKQGAINVGAHEFLHPIFNKLIGDVKTQGKYVKQFKRAMTSAQRRFMEKEMDRRGYTSNLQYNTEYINVFSDALRKKRINYDKNVFEKLSDTVLGIIKPKGYENASFESGREVYNFIKEYDKSIEDGKLTKAAETAIGDVDLTGVTLEGADLQASKTQLEGVKKRLSDIPAADVESRVNVNKISAELPAMIGTQINNKFSNLDPDTREEFTFDVLEKILRPNKEGVNKDLQWDGRGDLYGFLNGRIGLRIRDAVREDYKRPAAERMYVGRIDAKQLEDLTKEPATEPTTETAPKKKTTPTEESVERGQATFDELDIVDDALIKDIKSELEKEIRVRVQKGTLSETVSVKKGRNTYIVSWLEDYINKQLFKKLLKKVGAIKGTYPNTVIPPAYIDFLQDPKTFDIITKALPIKSIKKSYGKLFDIERVGREETAEGNPIFRIKKIDKTKFFKYFVDGKKSTILERQKQLFREILTPIAKQAVADYATVENLQELKSIQELAPEQSVDIIGDIAIEAEFNNLISKLDRYKGEKGSFDIIQFSQLTAKDLQAVNAAARTDIDSEEFFKYPKKIREYVRYLHKEGLIKGNSFGGLIYENFIAKKIKSAARKIPGLKVISTRGAGFDSTIPDIELLIEKGDINTELFIEVKKNRFVRFGQVSLGLENGKIVIRQKGKIIDPLSIPGGANLVKSASRGTKYLENILSLINKLEKKSGENKFKKFPLGASVKPSTYDAVVESEDYKNFIKLTEELNQERVANHYNKKGVYYIQIGGKGLYFMGKDVLGLGVPELKTAFTGTLRFKRGNTKSGNAFINIVSEPKMKGRLSKSTIDLNSVEGVNKFYNNIAQFSLNSATNIEFQDNEAFAGSKSGFFTINGIEYVGALTGFNLARKDFVNAEPLIEKLQQLTGKKNVETDKYQVFTFDRNDAGAEIVSRAEDNAEWNGKRWVYPESDTKQSLAVFGSLSNYFLNEIKKGNLDGLVFSGREPSRQRLYNALSERFAKKLGWNYGVIEKPINRGGNTYFIAKPAKIQFSKTKYNWDPFDMADVVTMSLFGKTKAFQNREAYMRTYKYLTPAQQAEVRAEMKKHKLLQFSKTINKAKAMINRPDAPQKGISIWDFDDTLATTKSNVLYTMPDGTKGKIDATQFAAKGDQLAAKGAEFDFSEFKKVMEGAKGPMFNKAVARNKKFGNDNVFILTARPADSKYAIHDFLSAIGLNIKIENIVGLGNSTAQAKAEWVIGKVAEGYNDFYFADDAYKNVKAVQEVLEVADVKSKVHQAKVQFSKNLNKEFNKIVEDVTGISAKEKISKARGKVIGKKKGRFKFFIPPSADDFAGLLYKLLGKGKKGEQQQAWFKEALFDPFAKGIREFESYKQNVTTIVNQLKKDVKNIPAGLKKENKTGFTNENAVRVYLWAKNGFDIDGLNAKDIKELVDFVKNNPELMDFADQLDALLEGYPEPQNDWLAGTITTDAINMINTTKRAEFLEAWQQNADAIFSEDNLNKLRAAFGDNYVEALEDMLYRMKTGRNRPYGANKLTNRFMNWVNDAVGTIMFFNTRSSLLQTLSTVNFINWGDNNPIAAAKAFANQKQFWADFAMLFNSDFLKQRRSGLKNDVNADDIANAAETATNKTKAVLSSILKMGFLPTQIADSFAIALGGASFVRNRINTYISEGLSKQEAQEKAFLDFQEIAEETQQSSRPDRISQQQASPLGRIILAFANTPMQYMRLTKKAFLDLKNGRGDAKTNITKMVYYTAVQNIIFSALQGALFAALFDDDDEELDNKQMRVANSMADSILRGVGVYGAIAATLKNIALEIKAQSDKPRPDFTVAAQRALSISPPIDSKMRKLMSAARAFSYKTTREKMKGYGLDNPAYYAVGQIVSAGTNVPLDRLIRKTDNIRVALDNDTKYWQSVALLLGYSQWDVGLVETSKSKSKKKKSFGHLIKYKPSRLTKDDLIRLKNKK